MRGVFVGLLQALLILIACAGIGLGVYLLVRLESYSVSHTVTSIDIVTVVSFATLPFLIGTVALAGLASSIPAEAQADSADKQLALLREIRDLLSRDSKP